MAYSVIAPTNWASGSSQYSLLGLNDTTFQILNAASGPVFDPNNTWALRGTDPQTLRFELRSGDSMRYGVDVGAGKERTEVASNDFSASGTPLHISYQFTLEPGAANTAKWMVIGQIMQQPAHGEHTLGPPVGIEMAGERMSIKVRYEDANGSIVEKHIYLDTAAITRGETYDMSIYANIADDASGRLMVVRDGKVIADYSGPLGYKAGEQVQWKEGLYREAAPQTIAADYANLQINHGDMVTIPPPGTTTVTLAAAPTLALNSSVAAGSGATSLLTGQATAGNTVSIYDNETLVATTVAAADGSFSATVSVANGSHLLTSTQAGADNMVSAVSRDVSVQVGTSADIAARLPYIQGMANLAAVVLTDGNTITATTTNTVATWLANGHVLDKVVGDYNFVQLSGTSNNRTATYFDAHGVKSNTVTDTTTNGVLTREVREHFAVGAPVEKEVLTYNIIGQAYTSQHQSYDASGTLLECTRFHADGTLAYRSLALASGDTTTEQFDATGKLSSYAIAHPAGSAIAGEVWTSVSGQAYASTYLAKDANGTTLVSTHSYADGSLQYDYKLNAEGSISQHAYGADGSLASMTTTTAGGGSVTQSYSGGALTGVSATSADRSGEVDTYNAGTLASVTISHSSGAIGKEVYLENPAGQSYAWSYQAYAAGKLVTTENYHADGTLDSAAYVLANGSKEVRQYDAGGVIQSDRITGADGSTDSRTYSGGTLTQEAVSLATAAADGSRKLVYDFDDAGNVLRLSSYDGSGKLIATSSPASVRQPDFTKGTVQASAGGHAAAGMAPLSTTVDPSVVAGHQSMDGVAAAVAAEPVVSITAQGLPTASVITPVISTVAAATPTSPVAALPVNPLPIVTPLPQTASPSLSVSDVAQSAAGASASASGVTVAGASVVIYDGKTQVGTVTAGASGAFATILALGAGTHQLTAVATASGATVSTASGAQVVAVGTAAAILPQLPVLGATSGLAGVVLTDTHVFTLSTTSTLAKALAGGAALGKIVGGYSFQQTTGAANDRTLTTYDSAGTKLLAVTDLVVNGALMRETKENFSAAAGQIEKEVFSYGIKGQTYVSQYQAYDSTGKLLTLTQSHANGTLDYKAVISASGDQTVERYGGSAALTARTIIHKAGTSGYATESWAYGLTGSSYAATYTATNAAGKIVAATRSYANGTVQYDMKLAADGTATSHLHASDGSITSTTVTSSNGASATQNFTGGGLTSTLFNHVDGSREVDNYVAGALATRSIIHAAGDAVTKEVYSYGIAGKSYTSQYQVFQGSKVVTTERYHGDGTLDFGSYTRADGSSDVKLFNAAGVIQSETITAHDKSSDVRQFTGGVLTRDVITLASAGPDGAGKLVYDGASHLLTGFASGKVVFTSAIGAMSASGIVGTSGADHLTLGNQGGMLAGGAGDDALYGGIGNDALSGGDGNDVLTGGKGADTLTGGAGADRFVVRLGDTGGTIAAGDTITDFSEAQGDRIDLSAMNAGLKAAGSATLHFEVAPPTIQSAGAIWLTHVDHGWQLHGDLNGDGVADLVMGIGSTGSVTTRDFLL